MTVKTEKKIKVAIIGGGPGGLGAAIELGKLPYVDWQLYEKKPRISESTEFRVKGYLQLFPGRSINPTAIANSICRQPVAVSPFSSTHGEC